jgi:hypothetical protein
VLEPTFDITTGTILVVRGLTGLDWLSGIANGVRGRTILPISIEPGYYDATLKLACGTTAPAGGGTACWDHATGELRMTVTDGQKLLPGRSYGITWHLYNHRDADQAAPNIEIYLILPSSDTSIPQALAAPPDMVTPIRGVTDGFRAMRFVEPRFLTKLLSQSTYVPQVRNTITLYLQTNVNLLQGDQVLLTGMAPTSMPSGDLTLTGGGTVVFGEYGIYSNDGLLRFDVVAAILAANTVYEVQVAFTNVNFAVSSPVFVISSHGSVYLEPSEVGKTPGDSAPLFVAGFTMKTIEQSSISTGGYNTISISFQVNRDFEYESAPIITISGLNGTQTPDAQPFEVSASFFHDLWRTDGGTAPLWRNSGVLTLYPKQKIAKDRVYDIAFTLHNAHVGQDARTVSIHMSKMLQELEYYVRKNDFLRETMDNGAGNLAPLKVFDFLPNTRWASIWTGPTTYENRFIDSPYLHQSTPSSDAINTITATLSPRADLTVQDKIVISNLRGAVQMDGLVQLTYTHAAWFSWEPGGVPARGLWNSSSASMTVYVLSTLYAGSTYEFQFLVRNPLFGQDAPDLYIEVKSPREDWGHVILSKRRVVPCCLPSLGGGFAADGDFAPLLVAGFALASLRQSTQSASATNRLTFRMQAYTKLSGQTFTISGLQGGHRTDTRILLRDESGSSFETSLCPVAGSNYSACHTFFTADGRSGEATWEGTISSPWREQNTKIVLGNPVANASIGGSVFFETARFVPAKQVIEISFELLNSPFGQDPPTVLISHSNSSIFSAQYVVDSTTESPSAFYFSPLNLSSCASLQ